MEEKKRMLIVGIGMLLLVTLVILIYFFEKPSSNDYQIYFIGRSSCGYCTLHKPNMDYISEKYGFEYEYIDTDEITSDKLISYLEKFEIDSEEFATPTTVIMKGNKVIKNHIGFMEEKELYDWFKENGVITAEYVMHYPDLKYIDFDDYKTIVENNDLKLIVLTQSTCYSCISAKPHLNEIAKEYNLEINYYDLYFANQDDYDYFYNSYSYIKEQMDNETLKTPTFLIVKDKKVVATNQGFESKEKIIQFLTENEVI